jgi:hypothetical protein
MFCGYESMNRSARSYLSMMQLRQIHWQTSIVITNVYPGEGDEAFIVCGNIIALAIKDFLQHSFQVNWLVLQCRSS